MQILLNVGDNMDRPLEHIEGNELIDMRERKYYFLTSKLSEIGQVELDALMEIERELSLREE